MTAQKTAKRKAAPRKALGKKPAASSPQSLSKARQAGSRKPQTTSQNPQTLKRTGTKPLTFDGVPILQATGHRVGPSLWYEITIFRKASRGYVVQTIAYKKSDQDIDMYRAQDCSSQKAMLDYIEHYDAGRDVDLSFTTEAEDEASITFAALLARQRIAEAKTEYRALSGDVLYELVKAFPKAA